MKRNDFEACGIVEQATMKALIERASEETKANLYRFCELCNPATWSVQIWQAVYARMLHLVDEHINDSMTENQKERAAIMQYEGGLSRWAAEDAALGRG